MLYSTCDKILNYVYKKNFKYWLEYEQHEVNINYKYI